MASYELDLTRRSSHWLRHLGRHRPAVFFEESDRKSHSAQVQVQNTTRSSPPGSPARSQCGEPDALSLLLRSRRRPGRQPGRAFDTFPIIYAGMPLPAPDPSGVTQASSAVRRPTIPARPLCGPTPSPCRACLGRPAGPDQRAAPRFAARVDAFLADYARWADARGIYPDPTPRTSQGFPRQPARGGRPHQHARRRVPRAPVAERQLQPVRQFSNQRRPAQRLRVLLPNPTGKAATTVSNSRCSTGGSFSMSPTTEFRPGQNRCDLGHPGGQLHPGDHLIWPPIAEFTNDPKYRDYPTLAPATGRTARRPIQRLGDRGYRQPHKTMARHGQRQQTQQQHHDGPRPRHQRYLAEEHCPVAGEPAMAGVEQTRLTASPWRRG